MTAREEILAMAREAGWNWPNACFEHLEELVRLAQNAAYDRAAKELSENRHMFFTDAGCESMCRGILALKEQA